MPVGGSFHGDFRVCIVVFRHHKYGVAFSCCYAYLTYDFLHKGHRAEGEEGVASKPVWVSCGDHLVSLSLRLMCLTASFGAESDSEQSHSPDSQASISREFCRQQTQMRMGEGLVITSK